MRRKPFAIRYLGQPNAASLHVASAPFLAFQLARIGRSTLWASAGDYMAYAPNDLPVRDDFAFYQGEGGRREFASMIGRGYAEILDARVKADPTSDLAAVIPRAGGGFEPAKQGGGFVYEVKTLGGKPIGQAPWPALHIVRFDVVEEVATADSVRSRGLLLRLAWGTCTVLFRD